MVLPEQSRPTVRNPYIRKRPRTEIEKSYHHPHPSATSCVAHVVSESNSKQKLLPIHNTNSYQNQSPQRDCSPLNLNDETLKNNDHCKVTTANVSTALDNRNVRKEKEQSCTSTNNHHIIVSLNSTLRVEPKSVKNPYMKHIFKQQQQQQHSESNNNQVRSDTGIRTNINNLPSNQKSTFKKLTRKINNDSNNTSWEDDTTVDWDAAFLQMEKKVSKVATSSGLHGSLSDTTTNSVGVGRQVQTLTKSINNNTKDIEINRQRINPNTAIDVEDVFTVKKSLDYNKTAQPTSADPRTSEILCPLQKVEIQNRPMIPSASRSMPSKHSTGKESTHMIKANPLSSKPFTKLAGIAMENDGQVRNNPSKSAPPLQLDRPTSWGITKPLSQQSTTSVPVRPGMNSSRQQIQNTNNLNQPTNPIQTATGSTLPALPPELVYTSDRIQPVADEHRQSLVKHAALSSPLLNGWSLFSHQKKAILRGLLMRRIILALDMGLGKTLIGCVWAKAFKRTFPTLKVFVICPVSLKKEWKCTAEEATGLDVQDDNNKRGKTNDAVSNDPNKMQICSWAKIPKVASNVSEYIVVCDEAHSMQSMASTRTKDVLQLVSSPKCIGVLLLTGTPMKNGKPLNLFPLLKAVRHPFGDRQKAYEIQFCAGQEKNFGRGRVWDANGSSNLPCLRAHVASHLLHMTKEQCLKDLPPRTRTVHKVPVSSRHQIRHNTALDDLARLYENSSNFESSGDAILGAVQRVRQIGSIAKIDATVGLANKILKEEPAIVIFTSFCQVAKSVHKQLSELGWNGELLTGETPAQKRQAMVDNFQTGLSSTFVCTFGAGGVGLTLTAAHTIILLDRPWTPGDASQAEDRVRRIGQTKPVKSIWMVAFDLDTQIDSVIEQKQQNSNAVLVEGSENNGSSAAAPKISVFQLLKSVLPKVNTNTHSLQQTTINGTPASTGEIVNLL